MFRTLAAALSVAAVLALAGTAQAGKYNKKVNIGDPMPAFSGLQAVAPDGKEIKVSAEDLKDKDVVVLVITCNHCPVAVAYENRIIDFARKYAGKDSKVGVVAVNVSVTDPKADSEDSFEKMVERSKQKGFSFAYAIDPSQKLG